MVEPDAGGRNAGEQNGEDRPSPAQRWLRWFAAGLVFMVGGYASLVAAAFASWSLQPAGWARVADAGVVLLISAGIGIATAAGVMRLLPRRTRRRWVWVGALPAAWGALGALGLW
jgi:branched-subunit amino acid ABC-type transport system permease component